MRTNYVLIDFENIQPGSLTGLEADHFKVLLFVGSSQSKVSVDMAAALQPLGTRVEYVRITGNGRNALDFHIAFHIGRLSAEDAGAFFHIISKDTGFDPLVQHLKARKILAARSASVDEIPLLKVAGAYSAAQRAAVVIANFQQRGTSKPRTLKTLATTIGALFQKQLSVPEVDAVIETLRSEGHIAVHDGRLSYTLPAEVTQFGV